MRILSDLGRRDGVFSGDQAARAGVGVGTLERLVRERSLVSLGHRVYVERSVLRETTDPVRGRMLAVAAGLGHERTVVSHLSAALVHDLPALVQASERALLAVEPRHWPGLRRRDTCDVTWRPATLPPAHVERRDGWAVSTRARTLYDLTNALPAPDALVAADAALALGRVERRDVASVATDLRTQPGAARGRGVRRIMSPLPRSPHESLARWHLARSGLEALPQVWAYDDSGPICCADLWIPRLGTVLEVLGPPTYGERPWCGAMTEDQRHRLERAGFGVATLPARHARDPERVLAAVRAAAGLARRGHRAWWPGRVGPPPRAGVFGSEIDVRHLSAR